MAPLDRFYCTHLGVSSIQRVNKCSDFVHYPVSSAPDHRVYFSVLSIRNCEIGWTPDKEDIFFNDLYLSPLLVQSI